MRVNLLASVQLPCLHNFGACERPAGCTAGFACWAGVVVACRAARAAIQRAHWVPRMPAATASRLTSHLTCNSRLLLPSAGGQRAKGEPALKTCGVAWLRSIRQHRSRAPAPLLKLLPCKAPMAWITNC